MPRIGRSFPVRPRPQRGPLSSLNFVPRISPNRANRPRQPLGRARARVLLLVAAVLPLPVSGLPTLVAEAAWPTDPLASPTWVTTPKCRSLKVTGNHRSAALGRFDAGVIVATFGNRDRSLEPLYAGGANYPNVKLRKRVRFRAVAHAGTGTTYPVAVGFVEKVVPTYPKDWKDAASTLTASDAFRLFAGAQLVNPYQAAVLADAPVAYYRLAESTGSTAFDSSGNSNNAAYRNSVALGAASLVLDGPDKAITITGDNGYVALPASVALSGTSDWTVEGMLATSIGTNTQWLFQQGVSGAQIVVAIGGGVTGTVFAFVQGAGAHISSASLYNDGLPHHYVLTHSAAGAIALYLDGVFIGSQTGATGPIDSTIQPPTIGQGIAVPGLNDLYMVDEVAIYPTVLSPTRIAAHYAAAKAWLNDTSDGRVTHVLDQLGWLAADRDLDAGVAILTDAGDLTSQKALDHLRLVDATEGGCLTMSRDGKVMMRNRHSIQTGPARNTVSQATFGDQGGTEIGYTALGMAFDDVELATRVTVTRRNGIVAIALDQAQITASGTVQDHAESSISNSDVDATARAQWLLALLKNPNRWRFETIVVPLTDSNQDVVLGLEKWDRITGAFTPPVAGGTRIIQDVLIVGIDHDVTKPGHWDVTFHTTGTDLQLTPFILNSSLLDGSDVMVF